MSQENVEVVRRCFGLWVSRNLSDLPKLAHPDLVLDVSRRVFNPAVYRGFDGFERFAAQVDEIWEDFQFEVEELVDAGESIVATTRLSGRGRTSGVKRRCASSASGLSGTGRSHEYLGVTGSVTTPSRPRACRNRHTCRANV